MPSFYGVWSVKLLVEKPPPRSIILCLSSRACSDSFFFNRARDGLVGWTELCGVRRPETDPRVEREAWYCYCTWTRRAPVALAIEREGGVSGGEGEEGVVSEVQTVAVLVL